MTAAERDELRDTDWPHGLRYVLYALGVKVSDPHSAEIERAKLLSGLDGLAEVSSLSSASTLNALERNSRQYGLVEAR